MAITLRLMGILELGRVLEIRNDPETYAFLHTPKPFTTLEAIDWFKTQKPIWYVIEKDAIIVGYMRTSDWNFEDRSIWIGCDIDKNYRRQGIAFSAYTTFINNLKKSNWNIIKLSVLKTNERAINLYKKLGFAIYDELSDSYNMSLQINQHLNSKKGVKVIACYFGNRRCDAANHNPSGAIEAYAMLNFIWKLEQNIDQGYPHDVCFVHNELLSTDPRSSDADVEKCKKFLEEIDGKKTANGKAIVIHRKNIGISFGAYDHAHNIYKNNYDFWFFTEDDQVIVQKDTYKNALIQLHMPNNSITGFVATVGVNREWGPGANGGCGITSREILQKVIEQNFCGYLNRGSLPFMYVEKLANQSPQTSNSHEWLGEVMFTKIIHDMGYYLAEHADNDINMSWRDTRFNGKRTSRCKPYETWMDDITLTFVEIDNILNPKQIKISYKLDGSWQQNNGDIFEIKNETARFNNVLDGAVVEFPEHVNIRWNNGTVYTIAKNSISYTDSFSIKNEKAIDIIIYHITK